MIIFIVISVLPHQTRTDPGTENVVLAECQMYLRRNGTDEKAGEKANIVGKSKFNQVCNAKESNDFRNRIASLGTVVSDLGSISVKQFQFQQPVINSVQFQFHHICKQFQFNST